MVNVSELFGSKVYPSANCGWSGTTAAAGTFTPRSILVVAFAASIKVTTNSDGAAYHDFHHTKNSGNFGGAMYLDYMFGTMDSYAKIGLAEGLTSGAGRKDPDDAGRSYLHSNKKKK